MYNRFFGSVIEGTQFIVNIILHANLVVNILYWNHFIFSLCSYKSSEIKILLPLCIVEFGISEHKCII